MSRLALDVLCKSGQPLKAYTVLARLEQQLGRQLSPPTVYRALDALLNAGRIIRIKSRAAFLPVRPADPQALRVVMLCVTCGGAREVVDIEMAEGLGRLAAGAHFSLGRSVVEVEGHCGACRADPEPESLD